MLISLFIILISLLGSFFFSGTETALIALFRKRHVLKHLPASVGFWLENPEDILSVMLLGNNISNILISSVTTKLFIQYFGIVGSLYSLIIVSVVVLIFGEVLPKSMALSRPEAFSAKAIVPLDIAAIVLKPASKITNTISRWISRVIHRIVKPSKPVNWDDLELVSQKGSLDISKSKEEMIHLLFEASSMSAFDLMTPRSEFVVIQSNEKAPCESSSPIAVEDHRGTIIGLVKAGSSKVDPETAFFPENTPVLRLFAGLFESKIDTALVINEYGEVTGSVDRAKIAAFLCGLPRAHTRPRDSRSHIFLATLGLSDIENALGVDFPKGPYKSLGGFIEEYLHQIPRSGYKFRWGNLNFTIIEANKKQIILVRIDSA